ncbi:unnamed protein product [Mytilus edulis]|uniref:Uncharacterized protein n=1 Tax=Mytilus edulis TaxID=6550 RepID=A0A8S3QFC6_MYTED|nr:unnamed protein product [Mytilus edulis]
MQSQNDNMSQVEWHHGLKEIPVKVDIQVKPWTTGGESEYYFPGVGSGQRSDDVNSPYGGIVYKYSKESVVLYAPNRHDGYPSGYAVYTGGSNWNGPIQQAESNVSVRIRVWGQQHFPEPDFFTNWTSINIGNVMKEIHHQLEAQPEYVVLQIKLGNTKCIADGIGYVMALGDQMKYNKWGGVLYGYDNSTIRIWTNTIGGSLFYAKDGWGISNESFTEGYYRIFAWSSLTSDRGQTTLKMALPFINSTSRDFEIELDPTIDLECDFIDVRIRETALEGSNTRGSNFGYLFKATGGVQNTLQNNSYSGVVYSYSSTAVRVWYPSVEDKVHYFIFIDKTFGGNTSVATHADLVITVFRPAGICRYISTAVTKETTTPEERTPLDKNINAASHQKKETTQLCTRRHIR